MTTKAAHVFRFVAMGDDSLARSEESWEGPIPSMLKGYSRRTLDKGIQNAPRPSQDRGRTSRVHCVDRGAQGGHVIEDGGKRDEM